MNIEQRHEDTDFNGRSFQKGLLPAGPDLDDRSVGRRKNRLFAGGGETVRVAEEIENEEGEQGKKGCQHRPPQNPEKNGNREERKDEGGPLPGDGDD